MSKNTTQIKRIAVLTSGGDAPGMNATIRAVAKRAVAYNIEPFLVYEGFKGLVEDKICTANLYELDKFISRGGTHIYTSRFPEFRLLANKKKAISNLRKRSIDALIVIGGNGSYKGALSLHKLGMPCVCVPGTIDNDISSTKTTIGFYTALDVIVQTVDNLRNTAQSHNRLMLVETMGRHCSDLTLFAGIATGAEAVVTAQNIFTIQDFINTTRLAKSHGKRSVIFVISEDIYGVSNRPTLKQIAKKITLHTGVDARVMVIGHLQRGASPSGIERVFASRFGIMAVDVLRKKKASKILGDKGGHIMAYDILKPPVVPRTDRSHLIATANKMNIR